MKLQILIPRYKEPFSVLQNLLDSIALQQQVDFSEVGAIICDDGGENPLNFAELDEYPFEVQYHVHPKKGVSATRNACLDHATADYVMFCDADDMFYNMCGLWIIFREIDNGGFDSLVSVFTEETQNPQTKEKLFINHDMDSTFVHGKVHKLSYLKEKKIRWNESLTIHEDSFFNILCQNCSDNVKLCVTPFYLWKWRDESVCRHDPKYILKTYPNMLASNDALVDEFIKRSMEDKAMFYSVMMIFDAYYTMNKPEWLDTGNKEYRDGTERRFAEYFRKHKDYWEKVPTADKMQISNGVRSRSIGEGMLMEAETIDQWLRKVESTW